MRKLIFCLAVFAPVVAFAQDAAPPAGQGFLASLLQLTGSPLMDLLTAGTLALFGLLGRLAHNANQSNLLVRAATITSDYVSGAVKHLLEGLGPDIKADLANDGVLDATERQHLLEKALLLAQAELPSWVQGVLKSSFGEGLLTMLKGKIASSLDGHLDTLPAAAAATPAPVPS